MLEYLFNLFRYARDALTTARLQEIILYFRGTFMEQFTPIISYIATLQSVPQFKRAFHNLNIY